MSSGDDFRKRTLARLDSIKSHLQTAPRSGRLRGKVCVITGVGSLKGIGRATAIRFAHEGARHLYLSDWDPTNLPNLKETIEKAYPDVKVTTIQADAADETAVANICKQALQEEGRLDVFFANAGIVSLQSFADISADQFMKVLKVNTLSASKAAVNNIAQTACYQLRHTDVRVNTICPGLIETGMTSPIFDYARSRGSEGKIGQLNPLGRYGLPQEIANVALFLASDEASYVNGQNWAVDGGLSSSIPVVPGKFA
ncbi:hypothetical protein BN946_scf184665.g13 [Trametes cinnabarina]|uniref:Ketoreductase (KR) domain-containing protein n=1 Tax=Pycnoporus cinnabarinus TaxID=5643 RepID=A0A060SPC5_PYCCI|nr:hypothetical protein BN946_scf184665.g13 [Trametes cinnabarina]